MLGTVGGRCRRVLGDGRGCRALSKSAALTSLSPPAAAPTAAQLEALAELVGGAKSLCALTGAGISTASGIPDYRSPQGSYSRGHKPMQHAEFVRSAAQRQRYWARSFIGFQYFSRARPNAAHVALAELEAAGRLGSGVVTQNVDGLHSRAGQATCVDLHGRIDSVQCLSCGEVTPRASLQARLHAANTAWVAQTAPRFKPVELRADGDSELTQEECASFDVPACASCGGDLMPGVTFFGGNVPPAKVQAANDALARADALLVIGSSLQVFSAYRLARAAAQRALPIVILNNGPTRADDLVPAERRLACDACEVLPELVERLVVPAGGSAASGSASSQLQY